MKVTAATELIQQALGVNSAVSVTGSSTDLVTSHGGVSSSAGRVEVAQPQRVIMADARTTAAAVVIDNSSPSSDDSDPEAVVIDTGT